MHRPLVNALLPQHDQSKNILISILKAVTRSVLEKDVLQKFAKLTGKQILCWSFFLMKLQVVGCSCIKK